MARRGRRKRNRDHVRGEGRNRPPPFSLALTALSDCQEGGSGKGEAQPKSSAGAESRQGWPQREQWGEHWLSAPPIQHQPHFIFSLGTVAFAEPPTSSSLDPDVDLSKGDSVRGPLLLTKSVLISTFWLGSGLISVSKVW